MKRIINKYHKKLAFPDYNICIASEEILELQDELATLLMHNHFIKEVLPKSLESKVEEVLPKNKGRKKSYQTINK